MVTKLVFEWVIPESFLGGLVFRNRQVASKGVAAEPDKYSQTLQCIFSFGFSTSYAFQRGTARESKKIFVAFCCGCCVFFFWGLFVPYAPIPFASGFGVG